VAHEVNNPLMAIAGHARSLAESGARDAAQGILAEVSRASTATRRLASLAAVQPEEFEWLDLNDLLRRTLGLMQYDQRYRAVRWNASLQADLPAVRSVASRLQQVLAMLLAVGADAIYLGGELTLTSREAGQQVEVAIVDTRGEAAARAVVARMTQERDTGGEDDETRALALARTIVGDLGARMTVTVAGSGLGIVVALEVPPEEVEA
jgi:two-component system, NtrC family, sensor kinase